jgi:hypothetical chaperone protein
MTVQTPFNTLGIDFGTSNSAAGVLRNGRPHIIELEAGHDILPTSVFFDFADGSTLFGNPANAALIEGREGRFMRSLKSVLGTSLMREKRYIMGEGMTFIEIIGRFLYQIKTNAEIACECQFDAVLSGRPVHFHSQDPAKDHQALIDLTDCYHHAGFSDVRFLLEPEAAAIASGALSKAGEIGLIVDIGGGTSDFSLFRQAEGKSVSGIDIIASHGVRVGGTDFDKSISIGHVMPLFGKGTEICKEMGSGSFTAPNAIFNELATWQKIQFQYSAEVRREVAQLLRLAVQPKLFGRLGTVLESELGHDVAFAVERGKISANKTSGGLTAIDLGVVEPGLMAGISPDQLGSSLAEHVEKIRCCAVEMLAMAECPAERVSKVIFVGGSSLMGAVETSMAGLFPGAVLEYSDAFTAIVDGLAIASDWSVSG